MIRYYINPGIILAISFLLVSLNSYNQSKAYYFGQKVPEDTPEIYAEGVISLQDRYEYGLAISPGGDEIFFTASNPGHGLTTMKLRPDQSWSEPTVADLRKSNSWEFEAFYSPDGKKLFFSSNY